MKKKILVILGHPDDSGFCGDLFRAYVGGAQLSGYDVQTLKLGELTFDPVLHKGYRAVQELEPDLLRAQELIRWAEHIVFIFPTWWSSFPSLLKGFFDRVILPGFGYRFEEGAFMQKKLLTGRSARVITTLDAPAWIYRFYFGAPGVNIIKTGVLSFCGISPVRTTLIGRVRFLSDEQKAQRLEKVRRLGERGR